jgi:hypothetical protein
VDSVAYGGAEIDADGLPALLAEVCAGVLPPDAPPIGPVPWLLGLGEALAGTPLEAALRRALWLVLRTGSSTQLATLSALASRPETLAWFEAGALMATLDRPAAWSIPTTAPALAAAISLRLARPEAIWDEQHRAWALDRRLDGALLSAALQTDLAFVVTELPAFLGRDVDGGAARLATALASLPDPAREAATAALQGRLPTLSEAAQAALLAALPSLRPPEPAVDDLPADPPRRPEPGPARPDLRTAVERGPAAPRSPAAPWRSGDGRWFAIPDGAALHRGPLELRRGLKRWPVDPRDAARFEVSAAQAAALQTAAAAAAWQRLATAAEPELPAPVRAALRPGARPEEPGGS